MTNCQCKAQGNKCSTGVCHCHREHISFTSFCKCSGEKECCNSYTHTKLSHDLDEYNDINEDDYIEDQDQDGDDFENIEVDDMQEEHSDPDNLDDEWL